MLGQVYLAYLAFKARQERSLRNIHRQIMLDFIVVARNLEKFNILSREQLQNVIHNIYKEFLYYL